MSLTYHYPQYDWMKRLLVGNQCDLNKEDEKVEKRCNASWQVGIIEKHTYEKAKTDHCDGID